MKKEDLEILPGVASIPEILDSSPTAPRPGSKTTNHSNLKVLLSSKSNEWATPQAFYLALHQRFAFDLDPASTHENAKCKTHYTIAENGLAHRWQGRVFLNPPYSRGNDGTTIRDWVRKAHESCLDGAFVCAVLPGRFDTGWFWEFCLNKSHIILIRGRLKFGGSGPSSSAPFPSFISLYCPKGFTFDPAFFLGPRFHLLTRQSSFGHDSL